MTLTRSNAFPNPQRIRYYVWSYFIVTISIYILTASSFASILLQQITNGTFQTPITVQIAFAFSMVLVTILFISIFLFVRILRKLFFVLRPVVVSSQSAEMRGMQPVGAIGVLRTIARMERFKNLLPSSVSWILALAIAITISLIVAASPSIAANFFFLYLNGCLIVFILWIPSFTLTGLPASERLLGTMSIALFLPALEQIQREHRGKWSYFPVKSMLQSDETFLIQTMVRYSDDLVREVVPALTTNLSPYWATIYLSLSLRDQVESPKALALIEKERAILLKIDIYPDRTSVSDMLGVLMSAKLELPKSWEIVQQCQISAPVEKHVPFKGFILSYVVGPTVTLLITLLIIKFLGLILH